MKMKGLKGFTLIELLLVIAILGILITTSVILINPQRQLAKARDSQRKSDLYSIGTAIYQFTSEHSGDLPDTDGDPLTNNFPSSTTCIGTQAPCFNLAGAGDTEPMVPTYLAEIPVDPTTGSDEDTGYSVYKDVGGRIVLQATGEVEATITVQR